MLREWEDRLAGFAFAPPSLVAERDMQRWTESKFVIPVVGAQSLLARLSNDYELLRAGEALVASYGTLYFDTTDLELFHAHRRGRRIRQKVRIRHYPDRRVSYLEIKMRTSAGMTSKARQQRVYGDDRLSPDDRFFVDTRCSVRRALFPQTRIEYRRITLLSTRTAERVTVDFDLTLSRGSRRRRLRDAAIVEVKQSRLDRHCAAMVALREAGWRNGWASKYCIAIALTSPEVRVNRLLVGLRALNAVATWES